MLATVQTYGLKQTVAPSELPVTIADVALHARIEGDAVTEDAGLIADLIRSAVERCGRVADLSLVTQTWQLTVDCFPACWLGGVPWADGDRFKLLRGPLLTVSSISYVDTSGVSQTLSSSLYQVDLPRRRIAPAYGQIWPSTRNQLNAVTVTYTAGFGTTGYSVPTEIKERLKAYVAYCYRHRENRDESYLDSLFQGFWSGNY